MKTTETISEQQAVGVFSLSGARHVRRDRPSRDARQQYSAQHTLDHPVNRHRGLAKLFVVVGTRYRISASTGSTPPAARIP